MMMMIWKSAVVALVALTSALQGVSGKKLSTRASFVKAMQGPPVTRETSLRGQQEARRHLYQQLLAKGRHVGGRSLENDGYGFDITQYSIKYTGCAGIDTYSDEMAEQEDVDTVLKKQKFALLRLCPTDSCNKYSVNGCGSDYSEILVDMIDYVEAMAQYKEEAQNRYCEYCERCYEQGDSSSANNGGRRLDQTVEQPEYDADAACEDLCGDYYYDYSGCDIAQDETGTNTQQEGQEEEELNIAELMQCGRYEAGQDDSTASASNSNSGTQSQEEVEYYVGAICASDGFTISLDIFTDEFCSISPSDGMTFSELTGLDLSELNLASYYPQECTSCLENEDEWEFPEDGSSSGSQQQNQNQEVRISEMCQQAWEQGAKCNTNFQASESSWNYMSYMYDYSNEEVACDFIYAISSGAYSETGTVVIDADLWAFNTSNWRDTNEYLKEGKVLYNAASQKVSPMNILGLVVSSLAVFVMLIWACCLHGSIVRSDGGWRPRRGKDMDPDAVSRQNSGIVMGRSRSDKTNPLI